MKTQKYKLKPEHEARFPEWTAWWCANALSCEPMTEDDRRAVAVAVRGMYAAAKLDHVPRVVFVSSPMTAAISAGVAAGIWWLRENPWEHQKLFGRIVSDAEAMACIAPACAFAVRSGMRSLAGEPREAAPRLVRRPLQSRSADAATDAATAAATRAATDAATAAATYAATAAATDAATYAATYAATDAATAAATYAATADATAAATAAATYAATYAATDAATADATAAATDAATAAATYAATDAATYAATDLVTAFLVRCTGYSYRLRNGGNLWSAWPAYLTFFRYVAELQIDYSKWDHYEVCARRASARYSHTRFCVVSDRPEEIRKDDRNAPHRDDGPSHRWRDGWEFYSWHGMRVPAQWIRAKHTVDPRLALTWENAEQRRALAEILGWGRVIEQLKPTVIDEDVEPEIGTLLRVDLPGSPGEQFLKVRCGTGRSFVLPVPPEMTTALQANAWTYGLDSKALKQLEGRT